MDTPSIDPLAFPDDYDLSQQRDARLSGQVCRCRLEWRADSAGCPVHGGRQAGASTETQPDGH